MIPVLNKRTDSLPDGHIYVGRPTKWGNPYIMVKDGSREEVIQLYRNWIVQRPSYVEELSSLNPTALVCWCAPLPCHADVLAELLDTFSQ